MLKYAKYQKIRGSKMTKIYSSLRRNVFYLFFTVFFVTCLSAKNYSIKGVVIDSEGNKIAKTTVLLLGEDGTEVQRTETSKKRLGSGGGKFKFKKVLPGGYSLQVDAGEMGNANVPVVIADDDLSDIEIILSKATSKAKQKTEPITPSKSDTLKTDIPLITPSKKIPLPPLRDGDTTSKVEEEPFFDYKSKIPDIQSQIDSLKIIMKLYEKTREMPTIKEELLDLIKVPNRLHRITLHNGTIILGEIIEERIDKIVLKTNIGLLVLDQETIMMIEEELPPVAVVEFIEEPQVEIFSGKEVITGSVINTGKKRGDFIRVIANLWTKTTELAAKDSAFINGIKMTYNTGVRTDTALEPDQTASFRVEVPLSDSLKVQYRTFDIRWEE